MAIRFFFHSFVSFFILIISISIHSFITPGMNRAGIYNIDNLLIPFISFHLPVLCCGETLPDILLLCWNFRARAWINQSSSTKIETITETISPVVNRENRSAHWSIDWFIDGFISSIHWSVYLSIRISIYPSSKRHNRTEHNGTRTINQVANQPSNQLT